MRPLVRDFFFRKTSEVRTLGRPGVLALPAITVVARTKKKTA